MPELARPGKSDHPDDSMRIFRPIIFARRFSSMEFCYAISCSRTMEASRACMGLLTAMILIGFTASSLLQGTDHSLGSGAAGTAKTAGAAHAVQQKHSQKAAQNPNH